MPKTSIGGQVDPALKEQARRLADKMDMTLSQYVAKAIKQKASRDDAEWDRVQREIDQLGQKSDRELEDRESALLDRLDDLSAAEERLLDAIQDELRERVATNAEAASVPA